MANIKISELEELTTVEDGDVLPIVDISSGETKKVKSNKFNQDYFNGNKPMGSIVVDDIRSKNFFDVNKITSTTVNGVTISKNANGGLVLNGTATGQIEFFYVELVSESKIKPGKTYTLSSNALPQDDKLQVFLQNSNSATWVSTIANITGTINPDTFTVSTLPGTHFKFLILILEGATLNNFVLYPQIEEGSTVTNYSEYKGIGYVDTGWHDLTLADNVSNLDATQYITAQCRRINNFVQIEGMLKVTAWNTKSMTSIASIPENYRPKKMLHLLANNNDVAKTMIVNPSGLIAVFDGANEWVSIHCSYMID